MVENVPIDPVLRQKRRQLVDVWFEGRSAKSQDRSIHVFFRGNCLTKYLRVARSASS